MTPPGSRRDPNMAPWGILHPPGQARGYRRAARCTECGTTEWREHYMGCASAWGIVDKDARVLKKFHWKYQADAYRVANYRRGTTWTVCL